MIYPNLEAELKRQGITRLRISEDFDLAISTVSARLTGKSPMSVRFAKDIKQKYGISVPLEILFSEDREQEAV